jgi:hypothetical protein
MSGLPERFRRVVEFLKSARYREARDLLQASAVLAPAAPGELVELAQRLLYFNLTGTLREVAQRLLDRPLWHAAAEADFAALLSMAGDQDRASRLLDRAMAVGGADPAQLYNRSQMHLYAGRFAEAEGDLRRCLALAPGMAKAHWALSKLPSASAEASELATLRALAASMPDATQEQAFMRYALFNRLDRSRQDDDAAWQELAAGCRAKRATVNYDPAATRRLFDALQAMPAAPGRARAPAAGGVDPLTPIFVVGMHRSGTTLLERMLGNHSEVAEGGELYDFPAQLRLAAGRHFAGPVDAGFAENARQVDFGQVGMGYLEQVRWRAGGRPFLVDKLPSNFLNIAFIQQALPAARIIHMRRGAMDTCYSNLKELFSNACAYSYDQLELADYYAAYHGLMAHWHRQAPGAVLDVCYEDLARNPKAEATRILEFCGLAWEDECLDMASARGAVNTASSAQVREPIHQRNIAAWRKHAAHLAPLAARLRQLGLE